MPSIFSKIIAGEIPSHKIVENDFAYAFLDIFPIVKGHSLVVPKLEVDKIYDLPEKNYSELFSFAKKISLAIEKSFDCNRVAMMVIGLEVPHAHIHLIPINKMSDANFSNPKLEFSQEEFKEIAEKIKFNL